MSNRLDKQQTEDLEKNWYVIHTYSGYENKVKANLEKRIRSMGMQDKIFSIIIPTVKENSAKGSNKKGSHRKVFPGYILVEMIMSDDSWYTVRNTPGVAGFVGAKGIKPIPLKKSEVKAILGDAIKKEEARPKVIYDVGQSVRVLSGPFVDLVGEIEEVDLSRLKLRVTVDIFGRRTPVELDYNQVEKI